MEGKEAWGDFSIQSQIVSFLLSLPNRRCLRNEKQCVRVCYKSISGGSVVEGGNNIEGWYGSTVVAAAVVAFLLAHFFHLGGAIRPPETKHALSP